ncbi:hypothetical protein QW131_13965 [Roseibium salinum]|nr:hypothetical protein [Roseibium salinum]
MSSALQTLVNDPGNYAVQSEAVAAADAFARELNSSHEKNHQSPSGS